MRTALAALFAVVGLGLTATATAAPVCEIGTDRGLKLFAVNVDGKPYKDKLYITYEDAAMLRDVLVDSGACVHPPQMAGCDPTGPGERDRYTVRLASTAGSAARTSAAAASGKGSSGNCGYQ